MLVFMRDHNEWIANSGQALVAAIAWTAGLLKVTSLLSAAGLGIGLVAFALMAPVYVVPTYAFSAHATVVALRGTGIIGQDDGFRKVAQMGWGAQFCMLIVFAIAVCFATPLALPGVLTGNWVLWLISIGSFMTICLTYTLLFVSAKRRVSH